MKTKNFHIVSLLMLLAFAACNKKVSQEDLIQTALVLKIQQWRQIQIEDCSRKALEKAEAYVDSMLIIYSLPAKLDTIDKPPKPMKPPKPVFKEKPDSVVIEKIQ